MTNPVLRKTIFISLLGHITIFSIFSLSFGKIIPRADYISVSFWGQILHIDRPLTSSGLISASKQNKIKLIKKLSSRESEVSALDKTMEVSPLPCQYYLKPQLSLIFNAEKEPLFVKSTPLLFSLRKREPMIIFHPLLPYGFSLYFKDRQVAHVELMFNIVSFGGRNSVMVKRKISSGNLEVDLLSMRYIWHYLFIQQARFTPNNWQTVKIDLSTKND